MVETDNEQAVREQIAACRKYMTVEPTVRDIRNMLDSSVTEDVDIEALLEESKSESN